MTELGLVDYVFQLRKYRITHPDGEFEHKDGKVVAWYPTGQEFLDGCCPDYKKFLRRRPYAIMQHCRTRKHIQNLYDAWFYDLGSELKGSLIVAEQYPRDRLKDPLEILAFQVYDRHCMWNLGHPDTPHPRPCTRPLEHDGRHHFSEKTWKLLGKPSDRAWFEQKLMRARR